MLSQITEDIELVKDFTEDLKFQFQRENSNNRDFEENDHIELLRSENNEKEFSDLNKVSDIIIVIFRLQLQNSTAAQSIRS